MAISQANFEAALDSCSTYIQSQDWANATIQYAVAVVQLSGLEERSGKAGSFYQLKNNLRELKEAIDASQAAAAGSNDRGKRRVNVGTKGIS